MLEFFIYLRGGVCEPKRGVPIGSPERWYLYMIILLKIWRKKIERHRVLTSIAWKDLPMDGFSWEASAKDVDLRSPIPLFRPYKEIITVSDIHKQVTLLKGDVLYGFTEFVGKKFHINLLSSKRGPKSYVPSPCMNDGMI